MKYRSKPVEIEAVQFTGPENYEEMRAILGYPTCLYSRGPFVWFGGTKLFPGLWIIKDGDTFSVMIDEEFQRKYEAINI